VERELRLEAQADRLLLAERAPDEAARDAAEEDGEVVDPGRDDAVREETRHRTEDCAAHRAGHGQRHERRRRLAGEMLCIELDDALGRFGHALLSSAAPGLRLSRTWPFLTGPSRALMRLLTGIGTVVFDEATEPRSHTQ
jgi:hypothetical protein